jgi:hypothetical protein
MGSHQRREIVCCATGEQRSQWLAGFMALGLWALLGIVCWWVAIDYHREQAISAEWDCSSRKRPNDTCSSDGFLLTCYILYLIGLLVMAVYAT